MKEYMVKQSDYIKLEKKIEYLKGKIERAIEYIELCWNTEDIDGYTSYDLSKEEVEKLLDILKGDSNE